MCWTLIVYIAQNSCKDVLKLVIHSQFYQCSRTWFVTDMNLLCHGSHEFHVYQLLECVGGVFQGLCSLSLNHRQVTNLPKRRNVKSNGQWLGYSVVVSSYAQVHDQMLFTCAWIRQEYAKFLNGYRARVMDLPLVKQTECLPKIMNCCTTWWITRLVILDIDSSSGNCCNCTR